MNIPTRLSHLARTWLLLLGFQAAALEPIPDQLVVLTFDDSVASQHSIVRPLLKRYGFGATFFITEGFSFRTNKKDYLTWNQIRELHDDGFEIGNHTRDHLGVAPSTLGQLRGQIEFINQRCAENGIPRPVSFSYPGNTLTPGALPILKELGIRWARRGGGPEHAYDWGKGFAYEPGKDHPLLIPSAGDARPDWTLSDFKRAVDQARDGRIAVMQFHGVPDREHPWVNTFPERFEEYLKYLQDQKCRVIAMRDLERFVDLTQLPTDPLAIVEQRRSERREILVEGVIVDAANQAPLPARLSIQGPDGRWHFPRSASSSGSAVRYERRNGSNTNSVEMHTALSADPFRVELIPGTYVFRAEHGKEYFPTEQRVVVASGLGKVSLPLVRWVNMSTQGWFSGDTHNHRDPAELAINQLAEDVNVALPMVDWTTVSTVAPTDSGRGFKGVWTNAPIRVDSNHVWYPRNTEYEIFQTGKANHTLGALVILNHQTRFTDSVLPLSRIAEKAHAQGALLDLEKHNWPWSIALVPIVKIDLFELANNHHWATEYAVRNWAVPAPAYMGLEGTGTDTERGWTLYGFQTYYALLNCGLRINPTAGTANGVHPVPLGFSRVYVHLDEPFSYAAWIKALGAGRSFVTTGPMLLAKADGQWPGASWTNRAADRVHDLTCEVLSEQPLESLELIVNGEVAKTFTPQNQPTSTKAFRSEASHAFNPSGSAWLAWRCIEARAGGRIRFAHSAPWHLDIPDAPVVPRRVEAEWLVQRVQEEIKRSEGIAPTDLIEEYRKSLTFYQDVLRRAR